MGDKSIVQFPLHESCNLGLLQVSLAIFDTLGQDLRHFAQAHFCKSLDFFGHIVGIRIEMGLEIGIADLRSVIFGLHLLTDCDHGFKR